MCPWLVELRDPLVAAVSWLTWFFWLQWVFFKLRERSFGDSLPRRYLLPHLVFGEGRVKGCGGDREPVSRKFLIDELLRGKESACHCRRCRFNPWGRKWQPTPVFLPGEFPGQRNLVGTVHGVPKSRT